MFSDVIQSEHVLCTPSAVYAFSCQFLCSLLYSFVYHAFNVIFIYKQTYIHTKLQLQLQKYTLQQKIVLRGVMQCKLVETSGSSALIGTAGDCCVVSECQVEVRSRPSEPQWRNFAGRWTSLPAKRTGHHGQPNEVTDVTNPRLGR